MRALLSANPKFEIAGEGPDGRQTTPEEIRSWKPLAAAIENRFLPNL